MQGTRKSIFFPCPLLIIIFLLYTYTGTVVELVSLVAQVCETSFFFQLDCIQINTHTSLKALFLNFQTFLQLTCSSYQGNLALSLQTVDPDHLPAFYQGEQTILKAPFLEHGYNTNREASLILPSWLDNKLFRPL